MQILSNNMHIRAAGTGGAGGGSLPPNNLPCQQLSEEKKFENRIKIDQNTNVFVLPTQYFEPSADPI